MNLIIRKMRTDEYVLLNDFLYQAIYQPKTADLAPKSIINKPELQVYINRLEKAIKSFGQWWQKY